MVSTGVCGTYYCPESYAFYICATSDVLKIGCICYCCDYPTATVYLGYSISGVSMGRRTPAALWSLLTMSALSLVKELEEEAWGGRRVEVLLFIDSIVLFRSLLIQWLMNSTFYIIIRYRS